ncbi:MAG: chorismate lyase [Sideroxyarcus sp.]|nr:chorismate lyase [Sideroxyarcus sp.]
MTSCKSDHFWNSATFGCSPALRPWLHDHGSLTQRIQQRCEQFVVQPVHNGLARIAFDEAALLGIAPHRLAWSREVFLYADGQPVVFAHSTCAHEHLRDAWQAMRGLGNRSLGSLLFTHPLVIRQPLHFKALRAHHPLHAGRVLTRYAGLKPDLRAIPDLLWARRSLFYLHNAPLLVTEVFLPHILRLNQQRYGPGAGRNEEAL